MIARPPRTDAPAHLEADGLLQGAAPSWTAMPQTARARPGFSVQRQGTVMPRQAPLIQLLNLSFSVEDTVGSHVQARAKARCMAQDGRQR